MNTLFLHILSLQRDLLGKGNQRIAHTPQPGDSFLLALIKMAKYAFTEIQLLSVVACKPKRQVVLNQ